jgi:membrane protein YdbS with pleckstrin-like domain
LATKPYIRLRAPERIEFRPRKWRWLALILFCEGVIFWGSILMMRNPDTLDHVVAVLSLFFGIVILVVVSDLFRSWSFAVTREGIEVNASLVRRSLRIVPWRDVTDIDVQRPAEGSQSIVVHVAGGGDVWLGTPEFHRSVAKTLKILREWRQIGAQSPAL